MQLHTVKAFHASVVAREELHSILGEHLALEHLRVFRRLLVVRCGIAIIVIVVLGAGFNLVPTRAWLAGAGLFAAAVTWVWLAERRCERQLSRRLEIPGVTTHRIDSAPAKTSERHEGAR